MPHQEGRVVLALSHICILAIKISFKLASAGLEPRVRSAGLVKPKSSAWLACVSGAGLPEVGSSRKMMEGSLMRAQAILSRLFSPPDSPRTLRPPGRLPPT